MPAFRLLVDNYGPGSAATPSAANVIRLEDQPLGTDGTMPLCELPLVSAVSGVYDAARRHLTVPCKPSPRLATQPQEVKALLCACSTSSSAASEFIVLLAPENGATLSLPREGASNASEVRVRPAPEVDGAERDSVPVVVLARGADPYTALLDAASSLSDATGASADDVRTFVLPLLDYANRMRYDAAFMASANAAVKAGASVGKAADVAAAATAAAALEQQLHEGILVQAGPDCPAKPLLQAPGLRLGQGIAAPLGVRYSGMSVVYGTATGNVLAVMDTAAALRMAPAAGMRSSGGSLPSLASIASLNSSSGGGSGGLAGAESPAGVSAGISATTSATPSPPVSRASSCGAALGDAAAAAAADPDAKVLSPAPSADAPLLSSSPPAAAAAAPPPPLSLSGRSITASPVIQIIAAAADAAASPATAAGAPLQPAPLTMPTSAPANVLASFAIVGVKTASGRDGVVRCCRIMPASALSAAAAAGGSAGLGIVVQVEVTCASSGTLRVFLEGLEEGQLHGEEQPTVRHVALDGKPARWRHDAHSCILAVEMPGAVHAAGGQRTVQVYL